MNEYVYSQTTAATTVRVQQEYNK